MEPGDLLLLFERLVHAIGHFLLLANHVFSQLVYLCLGIQLDSLTFLQGLCETFSGHLFPSRQLGFLLLNIAQLRVEYLVELFLLVLDLGQVLLDFGISLLCELGLEHKSSFSRFIEEVGTVGKSVIAELLGDALRIGTLGTLFYKVVEEAKNLEIEALKAIILVVVQFLSDSVIVTLEEVLALLIGCLFVFHRIELKLLLHLHLQLAVELVTYLSNGCLREDFHRLLLGLLVNVLELGFKHGALL